MMLCGTELGRDEAIKKYAMKSRFRILSKQFGNYHGNKVFETEQICVETNVMSYKIGPEDWEFMAKYFAPTFSEQDLVNMDKFKSVNKIVIDNQPTTPFSMIPINPYLEKWDYKVAKALVELSRLKYGRDKDFVSKEIEYRIWVV